MEKKYFKKEKLLDNYSYRKSRIKGNQQTNILKTYNNINNEIIINIKNNEKYSTDKEKKYEVRRIRLKLPNELIQKKDTFDFLNLNLRDTNNSIQSNKQRIPNSILYKQNLKNKKIELGQLINDFSIPKKFNTSNNINNTFQYNNENTENDIIIKKTEKKEIAQIPINKVNKIKYYKKPFYSFGKIVYHKINNLSYRNKKQSTNNSNNKKLILENIKNSNIYSLNPINNFTYRSNQEKDSKINIPKITEQNININNIKYKKIKPLEIKENLREKRLPINVNRIKKFNSSNITKIKEDESDNKSNIIVKTRNTFNRKSFRFLVNQTNKNSDLSTSFTKCYNNNNSKKKLLLKSTQIFSNNDSLSYSNVYYDTESNNESSYNNEINIRKHSKYNTQKTINNNDKDNPILICNETKDEEIKEIIPHKKRYILSSLNTPKYNLINRSQRTNTSQSLNSYILTSDIKNTNQSRNISAISLSGINLDLYYLVEKMKIVVDKIRDYEKCSKECDNYLTYYFEHNFYNELLKPFKNGENVKRMEEYIKLEITCYFLCYNISIGDKFKITEILLKSIFDILFNNFMLYLCLIVSQCENKNDNIVIVLNKIIKDNINTELLSNNKFDYYMDENKFIFIIINNSKSINDYYNIIINNIYKINIKEINDIKFPECILNIKNNNISEEQSKKIIPIFFTQVNKYLDKFNFEIFENFFNYILNYKDKNNNNINNNIINKVDYNNINININSNKNKKFLLPEIAENKEYSLILDLEDTLIHSQRNFNFRNKLCNVNKKLIIFRPYLFEFLHEMKSLFELILFSSNTPEYVDPIVNLIQKEQKYFDYVLYRHHITLDDEGNNVKNLELIGRDLKKVIIIDDIARYFNLQKENGINIKPFYGNSKKDGKTLLILGNVLKTIKKDADKTNDIRISLNKYKKQLFPDVIDNLESN